MGQAESPDDSLRAIGRRIREIRKRRGLTLQGLAERVGLSPAHLSQIENGHVNVNLSSLGLISQALETPMINFFAEARPPDISVLRLDERRWFPLAGKAAESLLVKFKSNLEIFVLRLPPGADTGDSSSHAGEEFSYVVKGSILMTLNQQEHYELFQGDGIHYHSEIPHHWKNIGRDEAEVIIINTPATF